MNTVSSGAPRTVVVAAGPLKRPSSALLYSALAFMIFIWSVNYIIGKVALRSFPPLLLSGWRTAVSGLFMIPVYAWARKRPGVSGWTARDLPRLLGIGVFGITLNQVLFVQGLSRTSVAHAAILSGLTPLMVLTIAASLRMEKFTLMKASGMLTALAGVAVLNHDASMGVHATFLGDFLILLGGVAFAIFTVAGKRTTAQFGAITVNAFGYISGGLSLLPITIWQSSGFSYAAVPPAGWAGMLFMAAFPAVVCYLIFYWALAYLPASRVAAWSYIQPVLATAMAIPLLGERLSVSLIAAGTLVFTGLFVSGRGR